MSKGYDHVAAFMAANDKSPVISGRAIEPDPRKPAKGGIYELENGDLFKLNVEECRALPEGYPKWKLG
jgi:hypothetical protein